MSSRMNQPIKRSPLHSTAQALAAQFADEAGWQTPEIFTGVETETAAARQNVTLADASANGKIMVQGQAAAAVLLAVSLEIGAGMATGLGHIYRLRPDLFFISTPPGAEADAVHSIRLAVPAAGDLVTVTDVTHGRAQLQLIGPNSRDLLSRLCGLDFHPAAFPNLAARQSSVAKTTQLIIRRDLGQLPAFALIGARSLAAYLYDTIMQAGRDLGIAPIGRTAIEEIGD